MKQYGVVSKDGKIAIQASELPEGTVVKIIVLVEAGELDETEYWLSSPANRDHLLQAIERVEIRQDLVVIMPEEWHEKYCL